MTIKAAQRATFSLLSCLTALLLAEAGVRGYFRLVKSFDIEMWRYARLLKQSVPDARSHIHRPNASAMIAGAHVRINSRGLRDRERPYRKPPDTYRILVVGDSVAFGFGVEEPDIFPRRLEALLNAKNRSRRTYEVINGGVGNYNTDQELAFLKLEGVKYRPDHILLAYYVNDAEGVQKYAGRSIVERSALYVVLKGLEYRVRSLLSPARRYTNYYRRLYEADAWLRHQETLADFLRESRKLGARLTVLILPDLHALADYPFNDIHRLVGDFFRRQGCDVIDALEAYEDAAEAKSFWAGPDDPHPNAEAHHRIARLIFAKIRL